jgi:electron transfer flavoprotein beta subunit
MLKVIVTLKQSPKSNQVQMSPDTNIVIRDPDEAMLTFDDCNALELALQMKDVMGNGIHITAFSMGNDKTEEILREALALGVDRAVLMNDERVRGADTPATAYTLAAAIRSLGDFDVVLTGHASMDGRTGHVGVMLAEYLNLPYLTNVCEFSKSEDGILTVKKDLGQVIQTLEMKAPAVLSNTKHKYSLRVMSIAGIRAAMKMNIERITLDDTDIVPEMTGLDAAKVRVADIQPSKKTRMQLQMFFDQYKDGDFDAILNEIQKIK